ncbi:MAG: N-acetylmuramic acid 6-phosphate etherase [Flavobacteriales bacterium]|jgi:N-acetylmuramic acid 6-phosphate etherase|tara:strand:- start:8283 stop:9095 length:813 start_codon:yes stop_codon:yes gene_type:complete
MSFDKITESDSKYDYLENKSINQLLEIINSEDQTVALCVKKEIPNINNLIRRVVSQLENGGRLFYIGSGTSGRLGVVDASECPPTFGVNHDLVIGIIAGGDKAIRKSIENAEDDLNQGWEDLLNYNVSSNDFVIGIAASGTTSYVIGALENCKTNKIPTGCITCNPGSPISLISNYPIEVMVGPEVITGSSRMKAGTAQKLILNMISSTTMIKIGKVVGNKMVDMQLSNVKLVDRANKMVMNALNISSVDASKLLAKHKSVRLAIKNFKK